MSEIDNKRTHTTASFYVKDFKEKIFKPIKLNN